LNDVRQIWKVDQSLSGGVPETGGEIRSLDGTKLLFSQEQAGMLVSRPGTLDDPRQAGKVTFPLVEMSMVTVAGIIADCDGWEDVADFGRDRLEELVRV